MKIVCLIMLGAYLLATVAVANDGSIGLTRTRRRIVEANEKSAEVNAKQESHQSGRHTDSVLAILEKSSKSTKTGKSETVHLERVHENPKIPWKYSKETTMRRRRSLNPYEHSHDHLNNSIYYRVHEVSNAIHLEPVVNQKPKKSSFDWVMRFFGRIMNTHRKDTIDSSKDSSSPKPMGPLIGPINFPGLGENVYIRQLEPLQDESSHVILHLVTRRPKIPSMTFRPGAKSPLDPTLQDSSSRILGSSSINRAIVRSALQSSRPYSTSHIDPKHLYSLDSRVPEFSTLGLKDVDHHRHQQHQPMIRSFHKASIYMPNYVQSAVRHQSQTRQGPTDQQVSTMYQHKATAHVHGDQLRNMAAVPLLPSHNHQAVHLYSTMVNEAGNNTTKMSADDGHLHKVKTVNHFPRSIGNDSMNFLTNHSEFRDSPVLMNYHQSNWSSQIVPLTWHVKDQYVNDNVRYNDRYVGVRSEDEEYHSGGGLEVVRAPKLDVESQSRLIDGNEKHRFFSDNYQSGIVNYESTWKTLKSNGSDSRNNLTVVDGIGEDSENATIGHFQKIAVLAPHYSWPSYKSKTAKIVNDEETIKPVFEIAEDRDQRGISGSSNLRM